MLSRINRRVLHLFAALLKYIPTTLAMRCRNGVYRRLFRSMGANSNIVDAVTILNPENIEIGSRVSMHEYCVLDGSGGIRIGDNVAIANSCSIISSGHVFRDADIPIKDQGLEYAPVSIGSDVWLGSRVTIVSGVTIGDGSIIGAGSVVTKDVPPFSIAVGVPCRVIKSRRNVKEEAQE